MLLPALSARAVQPERELGKVTKRHENRIIGREERDNTFRRPGSILWRAKTEKQAKVDPALVALRQRAMCRGQTFTSALAPRPAPPGPAEAAPAPVEATAAARGLNLGYFAALAGVLGMLLLAAGWWLWRPRRAAGTAYRSTARRRRRRSWTDRDLKITMGRRD